jgi:hypothetical protein
MKIAYIAGINESALWFRVSVKGVMIAVSKALVIQQKPVFLKQSDICLLPSLACDSP